MTTATKKRAGFQPMKFANHYSWAHALLSINYHACNPRVSEQEIQELAETARRADCFCELVEACQAALKVLPGLEVRSWPPGHEMKLTAIELLQAALTKAGETSP